LPIADKQTKIRKEQKQTKIRKQINKQKKELSPHPLPRDVRA